MRDLNYKFWVKGFILLVAGFMVVLCIRQTLYESAKDEFVVKVDRLDSDHWKYEIYYKDRLLIKQQTIPAINGLSYFKSKEDAQTVALMVKNKLELRMSPTVTINELRHSGIALP